MSTTYYIISKKYFDVHEELITLPRRIFFADQCASSRVVHDQSGHDLDIVVPTHIARSGRWTNQIIVRLFYVRLRLLPEERSEDPIVVPIDAVVMK